MLGSSTQRSQRGSTPSFRVENCTTAGTGAVKPPLVGGCHLLPAWPRAAFTSGSRGGCFQSLLRQLAHDLQHLRLPQQPVQGVHLVAPQGPEGAQLLQDTGTPRTLGSERSAQIPAQRDISGGFIGARSCREPWPTPPPCPSPGSHQQQAVAVVEVKHQGFIQELVAGAHGVGTAVGATACPGVVCSHLTGAGGPAHTPGSAGPPKNQGEIEPGQCREPGSSPSSPPAAGATLGSFCRTYSNTATQDWTKESVPGSQGTQVSMETWGVPSRARSFSFMSWDCPQLR